MNTEFTADNNQKTPFYRNFLKLAGIYIIAFLVVFTLLNISVLANEIQFIKNQFTDEDEILETNLLRAAYNYQAPTLIPFGQTLEPQVQDWSYGVEQSLEGQQPILIPSRNSYPTNPNSTPVPSNISANNYLHIPKINVKVPIITGNSTDTAKILKDLEKGVLMYPGSPLPGQGSGTVIIGHSSSNAPWNKYSNAFSLLSRLDSGDLIYVNYGGKNYVYVVSVKKTGSVFSLTSTDMAGDLILSSCWPIGTDSGRIMISANRVP